jgi:broad specificity phosphatase PhoE
VESLRVFVIRHAETEWSRARRFAGSRDIPLTDLGRLQCEAVAQALAGEPLTAVYASPLERARASAEVVAKPHCLAVSVDEAFREMAFGTWEGLTRDEVATSAPEAYARWRRAPHQVTPPGGESLADVAERVTGGLRRIRAAHAGGRVALVSHAIVARLIVLDALGLGPDRLWSLDASPAGITEIEYQPTWVTVHRMNTLAHLRTPDARSKLLSSAGVPGVGGAWTPPPPPDA